MTPLCNEITAPESEERMNQSFSHYLSRQDYCGNGRFLHGLSLPNDVNLLFSLHLIPIDRVADPPMGELHNFLRGRYFRGHYDIGNKARIALL